MISRAKNDEHSFAQQGEMGLSVLFAMGYMINEFKKNRIYFVVNFTKRPLADESPPFV